MMSAATKSRDDALDRLVSAYRCEQILLMLFDYDGTLVPTTEHPRNACLGSETRRILELLSRTPRVRVGIVSGRAIDDLKTIVGIKGIDYVGTCGLELELNQVAVVPRAAIQAGAQVPQLAGQLKTVISDFPNAWIEQKPLGLTVHYRHVHPDHVQPLRLRVTALLEPWINEWCLMDGTLAIEIIPNRGLTKGTALQSIVGQFRSDQVYVMYAGDSINDAAAIEAAITLGGTTVGIGCHEFPSVHCRLPDPSALTELLKRLVEQLSAVIQYATVRGKSLPAE